MNYFVQHWRGDLPLRIAFWVNGVFITFLVRLFDYSSFYFPFLEHPRTASRFVILFLILTLTIWIWQIVGIWRSSRNNIKISGKKGFSYFVNVVIVAGVVGTLNNLSNYSFDYTEAFKVGFTEDEFSDFSVTLSESGSEIYIIGYFGWEISDKFEDLLGENPQVTRVVFESEGGWVYEGQLLSETILKNNLDTATISFCNSACTLAFISGKYRYISQSSNLGFHAFSTYNTDPIIIMLSGPDPMVEWTKELFKSQGVSSEFIQAMFQATNEDMWYPTTVQLLNENVVHGVIAENIILNLNQRDLQKSEVEAALLKIEFYKTIQFYEPDFFQELTNEFYEKANMGATEADLAFLIQNKIASLISPLLVGANNQTLLNFIKEFIPLLEKANKIDPFLCMKMIYPENFGAATYIEFFTNEEMEELLFSMNLILNSYYTNPAPEIDQDKATRSISGLIANMEESAIDLTPLDLTPTEMQGAEDYHSHCLAITNVYIQILELEEDEASNILRYLFSE